MNYYNEIDPFAAEWLRNLIDAGEIAPGIVDERSIEDVAPIELMGYTQCHFFAGIGGWSRALRLAGWPDDRTVWTGSPPCQPFSAAGKGDGFTDERHLWPAFHHLICVCKPPVVYMEQVASTDGLIWLDLVQTDLEGEGYAVAPFDLCAAGISAPHLRQRQYIVAYADPERCDFNPLLREGQGDHPETPRSGEAERLANAENSDGRSGIEREEAGVRTDEERRRGPAGGGAVELGNAIGAGLQGFGGDGTGEGGRTEQTGPIAETGESGELADTLHAGRTERRTEPRDGQATGSGGNFWRRRVWIPCSDGKSRPVEPGSFPLSYVLPRSMGPVQSALSGLSNVAGVDAASLKRAKRNRLGRLRGYGNAIVPELAALPIMAYMEHEK